MRARQGSHKRFFRTRLSNIDQRADYVSTYEASVDLAEQLVSPLSESQFNWKPSATAWSVGECLEHLNLVARQYVPAMEQAIRGASRKADGPYRYGWLSRKFIESVSLGSRAVNTAAAMRPEAADGASSSLEKDETLSEFVRLTNRYIGIVRLSEGVDIGRVKVRSPFLSLLRLPVGAFMEALGQHALRHVDQAVRVTRHAEFPAGDR